MHRRGFKHRISSHEEECRLGAALLDALDVAGTPGSLSFENPDAIVAIETVGQRAGISLWSREDLERYPFLRLD
jgi:tRNA(Ser,Leu) C12 N-acetylase TAN1